MKIPPKPRRRHRRIGDRLRPPQRVITLINSESSGARLHRWRVEPTCGLARRHWAVGVSPILRSSSSTFLRPFAPDPLRPFVARMDALTPARAVLAVLGLFPAATPSAPRQQVSLIHAPDLPTIPSPTTCVRSVSPRHVTCRRIEPRLLPYGNSGLRHSLAGSPRITGRIEFRFLPLPGEVLRTGRSPPAAPHPVSPRRSCRRLQVTSTWRGLSPLWSCALSGALAAVYDRRTLLFSKPAVIDRRYSAIFSQLLPPVPEQGRDGRGTSQVPASPRCIHLN